MQAGARRRGGGRERVVRVTVHGLAGPEGHEQAARKLQGCTSTARAHQQRPCCACTGQVLCTSKQIVTHVSTVAREVSRPALHSLLPFANLLLLLARSAARRGSVGVSDGASGSKSVATRCTPGAAGARDHGKRTASCAAPASCPRACSWRAGVCPAARERRDAARPRQLLLRMTPQRAAPEGGSAEGARSPRALRAPGRCSGAHARAQMQP